MSKEPSTKMNLFEHLNNISSEKRKLTSEELVSYAPFIINRCVSMIDIYLPLIAQINQYDLPKDVHNQFLQAVLPKRKQYFKYIKNKKEDMIFEKDCLRKYFECGPNDVNEILDLLKPEQLEEIVSKYRIHKPIKKTVRTKTKKRKNLLGE